MGCCQRICAALNRAARRSASSPATKEVQVRRGFRSTGAPSIVREAVICQHFVSGPSQRTERPTDGQPWA